MNIGEMIKFFSKNIAAIKALAYFLPVIWAMYFTKDWVSISCFYKFYEINRTHRAEIKQLLNLRYIASLFISSLIFICFCVIICYVPLVVLLSCCIIPLLVIVLFIKTVTDAKKLNTKDKKYAENYRRLLKNGLLSFRITYITAGLWVLVVLGSLSVYHHFEWLFNSTGSLLIFLCISFAIICVLVDNTLTVISTSINQPSYFNYLAAAEKNRLFKKEGTNFYRFNESVTIAEDNDSTYIVVFPFENETRTILVGMRALICRKENNMVHAYLVPAEIKYDVDLAELNLSHVFVDEITRLGLDVAAPEDNRKTDGLVYALNATLQTDNMKQYWDGAHWKSVKKS